MRLLVGIHANVPEWREALASAPDRPRLPIPYAFGAAFAKAGHRLYAVDYSGSTRRATDVWPFEVVYRPKELGEALRTVDLASLWAFHGVSASWRQAFAGSRKRKVVINSYVWDTSTLPGMKKRLLGVATHVAALMSKGLVVMTEEQRALARAALPPSTPVVKLTCGIDTAFYRAPREDGLKSEALDASLREVLSSPYIAMPGDELRFNDDALAVMVRCGLPLVRICQYADPAVIAAMRGQAAKLGIADRLFILQKVGYPLLRHVLRNAVAYAGLVNSAWQPAGWTVACEALASGVPIVLYEGLVSRELQRLGADSTMMSVIPMRNTGAFADAIASWARAGRLDTGASPCTEFAAKNLDLEETGAHFVREVEALA